MSTQKILLLIATGLVLLSGAAAQDVLVDGLEEEEINQTYRNSSILFETSYLNKSIGYQEALVYDEWSDDLAKWQVKSKTESGDLTELQVQYEFNQEKDDGDGDLPSSLYGVKFDSKITFNRSDQEYEFKTKGGEINVTATSHYEHLILNYTIDKGSFQNKYSGKESGLIPIDAFTNVFTENGRSKQAIHTSIDNKKEEEKNVTVLVAYKNEYSYSGVESEEAYTQIDSTGWYAEAEDRIINQGLNDSLIVENTEDYSFKAYNLTLPEDSETTVTSEIVTDSEIYSNGIKTYVLGSIAGTTTYETSASSNEKTQAVTNGYDNIIDNGNVHTFTVNIEDDYVFLSKFSIYTYGTSVDIFRNGNVIEGFSVSSGGGQIRTKTWSESDWNNLFKQGDTIEFELTADDNTYLSGYSIDGGLISKGSGKSNAYHYEDVGDALQFEKVAHPPQINEINTTDFNWSFDTSQDLSVDVTDSYNDLSTVEYKVNKTTDSGSSVVQGWTQLTQESGNWVYDNAFTVNESGNWTLQVKATDQEGDYNKSVTTQEIINNPPAYNSLQWNTTDPIYGDTVRLELNTTDPENDAVTSAFLKTVKNGTKLFEGNGTQNGSIWYSPPVTVNESNVWYNGTGLNATDSKGATANFGNTASFYIDNPPPQISSAELVDNRSSGEKRLDFVLDDRGQSDIGSSSGISNIRTFTNSSLVAGVPNTSLASDITVSDFPGLSSDPFTANFTVSNSGLKDDPGYTGNLSSQRVIQTLNITNKAGAELNYSQIFTQVDQGENLTNTGISGKVQPESTVSNTAEWKGDWIQEQAYNTSFGSGQVVYGGGIEQRFNATQRVYTNNTQGSVRFNIDFTEPVSTGFSHCQLVNNTVQPVAAGHTGNHSFVKSCNPGKEISYTPVQKTDLGDKYKYNLTTEVEVFSELTSEQEHWIGIPQARLDKWQERNPDDTEAYVDGQSSEVRVEQGVINDTEYVFVVVSDEFGSSSLHTGQHTASLIYTEGGDSSSDTGSSGSPGQIGDPIEEVEGESYSWDLYNVRSQEQENVGFSIAGVPGREFERRLAVRNTGEESVMLELECISDGDACDWVDTSVDKIRLDTQDNTVSYFDVNGRVPTTAEPDDTYRFSIQVSDPSFDESTPSTSGSASADFVVSISPFFGSVIEGIRNLMSWKEWTPPEWAPSGAKSIPYPFAALPLFSSIAVYGLLGLVQRRFSLKVSQYDEIGKFLVALLVFLIVTGLA